MSTMPGRFPECLETVYTAADRAGLPLTPIHWELVSASTLGHLMAYDGLPTRYPHWTFGQNWSQRNAVMAALELVVYDDPIVAFVDARLDPVVTLMIIAHVLGHAAIFHRHRAFRAVPPGQLLRSRQLRALVQTYQAQMGIESAEAFLDAAQVLAECSTPDSDVLGFCIHHASHLTALEDTILRALHQEACYFLPLQQTKLLHEGYATFWHRRILHDLTLGTPAFFPFLQQHTQVLSGPGHPLHPYRDGDALIRAVIAQSGGLQALDSLITSGTDAMLLHRYWTPTPESMSTLAKETFPDPNDDPMVLKSAIIDRIVHPAPPITVDSATTQTTGHLQLRTPTFPRDLDQPRLQAALHCVAQSLWRAPVTLISEVSSDRWTANPA